MKMHRVVLFKVLVFAAVAAVMTVALGVKLANTKLFVDDYEMAATFDDATGVMAGDTVKLAGVDVGRVTGTEIKDGRAIVRFTVEEGVEIPVDSVVGIRWRNVLGQRFLYLYPGDEQETFAAGETIPASNTRSVNDVGELLNKIGPILKAIDPDEANAFLDAVNTALQGNEADIRQLLDDGSELVATLAQEDDTIRDLLGSADTVTAAFASQDEALGEIFDHLDNVGYVLERRLKDVNSLVSDFSVVQRELDEMVTENASSIDATLAHLDTVANLLGDKSKLLGEALRTLPLGVAGYQQTSSWGEFFNVRITKLTFMDRESEIIVERNETDNQHSDSGGSPEQGDGAGDDYPQDEDGDDTSDPDDEDGGRSTSFSEGIESILRFVLLGGAR